LYRKLDEEIGELTWISTLDLSTIKVERMSPPVFLVRGSSTGVITEKTPCNGNCVMYFLTDDLTVVAHRRKYSIESIAGEVLWTGKLNANILNLSRSNVAPRFAFMDGYHHVMESPSTLLNVVRVIDWSTNKDVAKIEIPEVFSNPFAGGLQSALALSPDGKLLAVFMHHTLTLYQLK
jgi:hypothetical protein